MGKPFQALAHFWPDDNDAAFVCHLQSISEPLAAGEGTVLTSRVNGSGQIAPKHRQGGSDDWAKKLSRMQGKGLSTRGLSLGRPTRQGSIKMS